MYNVPLQLLKLVRHVKCCAPHGDPLSILNKRELIAESCVESGEKEVLWTGGSFVGNQSERNREWSARKRGMSHVVF